MFASFSTIFISILLEALPFVILGTLFSGFIEVFVPNEWLSKQFKDGKISYYIVAGLMGLVFPVCECAIVPIMKRLVKKGVPIGVSITFMLAVPIVNPVVLLSTYYAFSSTLQMMLLRGVFGFVGAIVIGLIISKIETSSPVKTSYACHCHHNDIKIKRGRYPRLEQLIEHTSKDFMDVYKYFIMGAFIATSLQVFVPKNLLISLGSNPIISILVMMLLGFVLSLCSEADAFIASSFRNIFPDGALLSFLIFGPMIDIKNTLMLLESFKWKFVVKLIAVISVVCFVLSLIVYGWVG